MNIKIVGAGGIGGWLLPPLSRYLNYKEGRTFLTVIDGDNYEAKNGERQVFQKLGNKAEVQVESLKGLFPKLEFRARGEYVRPESIDYLIQDGDIIFLCVDNHKTRHLLSGFCEDMSNIVLISGGNDYTDGNVQVHVRKDDFNVTWPIANKFHPEIQRPSDKSPHEMSCEELAVSEPQLIFTNFYIASLMLNAFYAYTQKGAQYSEVYGDIITNNSRAVVRA
jgi:molybdopterin/thiamine biosynthesis adenylyltransferase